ncbi:MAG: BamA/TamA family outer membrane protein [Sedimentisphaerales bacterium]|nr:BamA/TamA family outer membrane protein [Sedimentisphaerales bacterium]
MKRFIFLTLLILTGFSTLPAYCVSAQDKAGEAERFAINSIGKKVVTKIDFVGNDSIKDKTLRKKLPFKVGEYLDSVLVGSGRITIADLYRKKGFADIKVTVDSAELLNGRVIYMVNEGAKFRIRSIKFRGNKNIKTGDLRAAIKIKTRNWLLWPVYYTEEKVATDVQKLRMVYYERGFLNYDIKSEGRSDIVFIIDEGPQYKVGDIIVQGNKYFDSEALMEGLELEPGQIYYPRKALSHAQQILKLYQENGFINAQVRNLYKFAQVGVNVVNVEFNIAESEQFRIGKIDITGNEQTQDKVVRRVLDEYDFAPGLIYNAHLAPPQGGGDLEKILQRRTMSEEVIVRPVVPAGNAESLRDLSVSMKEGLTGMWNPGIAITSDSGVIGQLIWQQRNFDITDWPESLGEFITMQSFKGAGQSLSIALMPGSEVSYYSVSFTEPYLNDKPLSLTVAGSGREWWRESHVEKTSRGYVGLGKRFENKWRGNLGFRVENVEIEDIDLDAPQEIYDVKGYNLLLGTRFGIGKDTTDYEILPSRGYIYNLSYEQVTGDYDFGILEGSGVWYHTLAEDLRDRKTVLSTKLLAATTFSNAPPFEKFYAGGIGDYGLRGFEYRGVSTRGLQTNVLNPQRKDPIGSDWIFLANTELSVPLIGENVSGLFFVDSGTIDTGPYRVSVGAGIQIMIPQFFGAIPMRFSISTPLQKDDDDETQSFSFFMGRMF